MAYTYGKSERQMHMVEAHAKQRIIKEKSEELEQVLQEESNSKFEHSGWKYCIVVLHSQVYAAKNVSTLCVCMCDVCICVMCVCV